MSVTHPAMQSCPPESRDICLYLTVGDDDKAVLSTQKPIVKRVAGTARRGLYPVPGELVWIPYQCLEGVKRALGYVPEPCVPVFIRVMIERATEEA